jgi:hypothetical protein
MARGRGFRTTNEGRVVRELVARGWEMLERTGTNHIKMRWPTTGEVASIPSSMDDKFARIILRRMARLEQGGA